MIDLDEIESAARKPWYCRSKLEDNLLSPEVLVELITRLRQAEKDAARYRWLRDESSNSERTSPLVFMADECADIVTEGWYQGIMFGEFLDCAMDEAMQCNK